jgi:hypothetical protein
MLNSYRTENNFEYSFTCPAQEYLKHMFNSTLSYYNGLGSGDFIFNDEIIYKKPIDFNKYVNSSILILGGGPSTTNVLEELPIYDYIWSVNYFYKNTKLPKVDLAVLGKDVDKFDKSLIEYISKNKTNIVFEEAKDSRKGEDYIHSLFPDQISWYNTRYQSKLGIGVRTVILAIMLGVKDIKIAGIDGWSITGECNHSFQKNKPSPKWGLSSEEVYNLTNRQFIIFWTYILELQKKYNFNITNLGENYKISEFGKITKNFNK